MSEADDIALVDALIARARIAQKAFETALAMALHHLDPTRPVVIEGESSKIGRLVIPPSIWTAMQAAPRIEITAPLAARAAFLTQTYARMADDPKSLAKQLDHLRRLRGHAAVDHWISLLNAGDLIALATALMVDHYDPSYTKSRQQASEAPRALIKAATLDSAGLDHAADAIVAAVSRF